VLVRHIVADHTDHRGEVLVGHCSHHVVGGTAGLAEVLEEELRNVQVEVREEEHRMTAVGSHHAVEGIAGLEEVREEHQNHAVVGMEVVLGEDIVGRSPAEDTVGRSLAVRNS
jgi:hypothetical protein